MDNSDRRVGHLETQPNRETDPPDDESDSDDDAYVDHRDLTQYHRHRGFRDGLSGQRERRGAGVFRLGFRRDEDWHEDSAQETRITTCRPRRTSSWDSPALRQRIGCDHRRPSCWDPPRHREHYFHHDEDTRRSVKMRAPHFDESDATNWISRV